MLEICSGSGVMAQTFREHGHRAVTIDINPDFHPDMVMDVEFLQSDDIPFIPDVIWFSPPCTSYSIAGISHHRKQSVNGNLEPVSEFAKKSDRLINNVLNVFSELNPKIGFIENPRGGLRKMHFMTSRTELVRYTITYCQYGDTRMKPTDIWSNRWDVPFRPMCHNGDPCHERAPRGSKTGTQGLDGSYERSKLPKQLCESIVRYCECVIQ